MLRAAVLGQPIAHSLSPVVHNAGYAAAGLAEWSYAAFECGTADLAGFVASLDTRWRGLSLTMPLKEVALQVAGGVSDRAAALGAANTLVRLSDGGWWAENTDAPGMVDALRWGGVRAASTLAILGAGGTARAALAAAAVLGASVTVYARRPGAVDSLRPVADALGVTLTAAPWTAAADAGAADVVISTVPKGVADPLALRWGPGTVAFDALYDPWPTPLAASAAAAGCGIVSGLDLLLAQAAHQFELFTGVPAPVDAMRAALAARVDAHR